MTKVAVVIVLIPMFLAAACFLIAVLQFLNIGFPFHSDYLFSSQIVREAMDKKPCFRQAGICFVIAGLAFVTMGLDVIYQSGICVMAQYLLIIALVAYIIYINKHKK